MSPDFRESDSILTKDQTMIILKRISGMYHRHLCGMVLTDILTKDLKGSVTKIGLFMTILFE